jgi:ribonuclease H2 subunit B
MIPALDKAREHGNFCDIEQCIVCLLGEQYNQHCGLLVCQLLEKQEVLDNVCDIKEACGQQYYRLSDEKTLSWLRKKMIMLKKGLCSASVNGSSAKAFAGMDDTSLTSYAANFLMSKYLAPQWREKLGQALQLNLTEENETMIGMADMIRASPSGGDDTKQETKRSKVDPKEAAKAKAMESRAAAKAAKLAKDAVGMKKMSSFFTPKTGLK